MQLRSDRDFLQGYLDGELSASQVAALEVRLRCYPKLAETLVRLAREEGVTREWARSRKAFSTTPADGMLIPVGRALRRSRRHWLGMTAIILGAAAAVLLVVMLQQSPRRIPVAHVAEVHGMVYVVDESGREWEATAGQELFDGQRLRTSEDRKSVV